MITENERAIRMIEDTPEYYHTSRVYNAIQEANAEELDVIDQGNLDIEAQLRPATATWGLKYWEERLGLITKESEALEQRRKKVLARLRIGSRFSSQMLAGVIETFTERPVTVEMDIPAGQIKIYFEKEFHADAEFFATVDNIIHAHLGIDYTGVWLQADGFNYTREYQPTIYPYTLFTGDFEAGTQAAGMESGGNE